MARKSGLPERQLEEALDDAENPKTALIELILEQAAVWPATATLGEL